MNEPVTKELVIHKIKHNLRRLRTAIKWIIFSILSGLLIGMVGIAFYFGMTWVTDTRTAYPWLIFFHITTNNTPFLFMRPFNTFFITIIKSTAILENICVLNLFTIFLQDTIFFRIKSNAHSGIIIVNVKSCALAN